MKGIRTMSRMLTLKEYQDRLGFRTVHGTTALVKAAVAAGIEDRSYDTPENGLVASYRGVVCFNYMGVQFVAIGYPPLSGSTTVVDTGGGIMFEQISQLHHD